MTSEVTYGQEVISTTICDALCNEYPILIVIHYEDYYDLYEGWVRNIVEYSFRILSDEHVFYCDEHLIESVIETIRLHLRMNVYFETKP